MTHGRQVNIAYAVLDTVSDSDNRRTARTGAAVYAGWSATTTRTSAMDLFAEELALSDSTARLNAIGDDWTSAMAHHPRGDADIVVGDLVRAADRDNIGTVHQIEPTLWRSLGVFDMVVNRRRSQRRFPACAGVWALGQKLVNGRYDPRASLGFCPAGIYCPLRSGGVCSCGHRMPLGSSLLERGVL